ncbi:MAG: hypothetical protein AB8E15_07750 [Bdellovibrionales bacterium]
MYEKNDKNFHFELRQVENPISGEKFFEARAFLHEISNNGRLEPRQVGFANAFYSTRSQKSIHIEWAHMMPEYQRLGLSSAMATSFLSQFSHVKKVSVELAMDNTILFLTNLMRSIESSKELRESLEQVLSLHTRSRLLLEDKLTELYVNHFSVLLNSLTSFKRDSLIRNAIQRTPFFQVLAQNGFIKVGKYKQVLHTENQDPRLIVEVELLR